MINAFIKDVCAILDIDAPAVSLDTSRFATDTMMAQCSPDGRTIYIKKSEKPNPDQLFSVAHELRHIWQLQTDKERYMSDYKPVDLCASVEEYNLQLAEIDANAFAGMVMVGFFYLMPQFVGVPDSVKSKIYDRMEELKSVYEKAAK